MSTQLENNTKDIILVIRTIATVRNFLLPRRYFEKETRTRALENKKKRSEKITALKAFSFTFSAAFWLLLPFS